MTEQFFSEGGSSFHRHDKPARSANESDHVSSEYSDLTEAGVEHAKNVAREEILSTIESAPDEALIFLGAKTDQKRTGQTAEIWGEALKDTLAERLDIVVITKKEIDEQREKLESDEKILDKIKEQISSASGKKIVIAYPLFVKQLGYGYEDRWTQKNEETGKVDKTEYFSQILKKYNNDHAACIGDWLKNDGLLTLGTGESIQGPKPEDVAKQYLEGLARIYIFVKKLIPERPILVHGVGHQWDLDAVATFLARGRVTYEDWFDIMGKPDAKASEQVIGEGEGVNDIIINTKTGVTQVVYRGKKFTYNNVAN